MTDTAWSIAIDRQRIDDARIETGPLPQPGDGEVLVRIDRFALTANNITYALFGNPAGLFGDNQGYWDFFSAPGDAGRLPVWGFATVVASRAEGVAEGTRLYGYYPMASHAVLVPGPAGPGGFADVTPRRTTLPPIYNQYQAVDAIPDYRAGDDALWPIFRPLYLTGWLIADQLEDEGDYGAAQVLVASASSKTAIGLAHAMQRRTGRPRLIALTSARNAEMVASLGLYDAVTVYDDIATLDAATPSVLIDMAGSGAVTGAVHRHFGDALAHSMIVGKAHWDAPTAQATPLPGPAPAGFFAPARSQKRLADWGPRGLGERMAAAWLDFMGRAPDLVRIRRLSGADAALHAYRDLLAGRADPGEGLLVEPAATA